ncbi:8889_t:CDS:1, partial [Funneliformis geosporum]
DQNDLKQFSKDVEGLLETPSCTIDDNNLTKWIKKEKKGNIEPTRGLTAAIKSLIKDLP